MKPEGNFSSLTIAIIGSGQLARMMALEGISMGYHFTFLHEEGEDKSAVLDLGHIVTVDVKQHSAEQIYTLLGKPDVVTVEKEHVDAGMLEGLNQFCPVYPSIKAIRISQNRKSEKEFIQSQGIEVAPWHPVNDIDSLTEAGTRLGWPVILKTCSEGYDGKGQWFLNSLEEGSKVLEEVSSDIEFIAEQPISFSKEVSIVCARDQHGNIVHYDISENIHSNGILHYSIVPARNIKTETQNKAKKIAEAMLTGLEYIGVLSIEFFVVGDDLMVNEFAPRVHNSGHWTQQGARTSQFLNHVRAISGQEVASTERFGPAAMINLLGQAPLKKHMIDSALHVHWYNKTIKANRKVGHINMSLSDIESLMVKLEQTLKDYQQ
ncbi:5-(carboxyamino)imidazole ribonucleotide synthase [Kangiella sediminilitoris]|uniref:N5-carboxyaminoimidazole ribonucleotide synthase n=1 Tax=Kangiella sediminilitoris TaxID=1144748 RepID=A0A1B3B832_9GAMM|nr:5-(carboxyamino)imidazole ribonucleotide synthase [Kangiella sediminilitoris]AOE48953.1 N5-carboxyaminoimidazole ribonucleotide synthase [Kangiella sediminilitoris]